MSPGLWLLSVGSVYFIVGIANLFFKWNQPELFSTVYCIVLSLPLWIPPMGRWVGLYKKETK
jgi:hypothetical protein